MKPSQWPCLLSANKLHHLNRQACSARLLKMVGSPLGRALARCLMKLIASSDQRPATSPTNLARWPGCTNSDEPPIQPCTCCAQLCKTPLWSSCHLVDDVGGQCRQTTGEHRHGIGPRSPIRCGSRPVGGTESQSTQTHGEGSNALSHVLLCGILLESSQDGLHCLPPSSVVTCRTQC